MLIPETPRQVFATNPLKSVICQLRFPTILLIDNRPVGYQERIRERYPFYGQRTEAVPGIPKEVMEEIPLAMRASLFPESAPTHDFTSKEKNWTLSLNRDFLALSCNFYEDWETFKDHLLLGINALVEEYKPALFVRIGLRYQNVIQRSELGLSGAEWDTLLNPYVSGELSSPHIRDAILEIGTTAILKLDQWNGKFRFQHGLVRNKQETSPAPESLYLLDNDLYVDDERQINDVTEILDYLNQQNGSFFRWCISETLRNALGTR